MCASQHVNLLNKMNDGNSTTKRCERSAETVPEVTTVFQKLRIHTDAVIDWIGDEAPVDEPECGFMGERCQPENSESFDRRLFPVDVAAFLSTRYYDV